MTNRVEVLITVMMASVLLLTVVKERDESWTLSILKKSDALEMEV